MRFYLILVPLAFAACTKAPANPVDEPEIYPIPANVSVHEDRFARCYVEHTHGSIACIPKVQEKN